MTHVPPGGRRAAKLALSIASLLATLGLCELAVRTLRPSLLVARNERRHFCEYDAELGWRNRAGAEGRFFGTDVVHNSLGQRDVERPLAPRDRERLRVMVLGDSFVFGAGGASARAVARRPSAKRCSVASICRSTACGSSSHSERCPSTYIRAKP